MENNMILKRSSFPSLNLKETQYTDELEIRTSPKLELENDEIEEKWLPPPDRPPPKPPSFLTLPEVPQLPPPFAFSIEPTRAAFTVDGGISKHTLINHSTDRLAIKIRCSNNQFFRVNPVFKFLDSESVSDLEIIRLQGGVARRDIFQIHYVLCRENDIDPSNLFSKNAKIRTQILSIITI